MAQINGLKDMTEEEYHYEIDHGGKFVVYDYTISILILTFKRSSNPYFFRKGENRIWKGLPYSAISLLLGWWGIPWGPIHTIASFIQNFSGGKNVTYDVVSQIFESKQGANRP